MTVIEAIILGIIQGATEFLPISSSGHLVLLPAIFNMTSPDLALIAVLHLGTLLAILIYFRRDLWQIATAVVQSLITRQPGATTESRLGWLILIGSIPAVVLGLLFEDDLEAIFNSPQAAAFFLLITAVLLIVGERLLSGIKSPATMNWKDATSIGFFQAFALFPGVSRSGATIVGGVVRGLNRPAATRFSFLLGAPVILGAGLFSVLDVVGSETSFEPIIYVAGFISAALVGYLCIYFLLRWVRNHTLYIFAAYCALLGGGYLLITYLQ